jgi:hypothetical protein
MHAFHTAHPRTSHANSMDHDAQIEATITDLELQERINYATAVKKWNFDRSMLSQCHQGKTGSIQGCDLIRLPTAHSRKRHLIIRLKQPFKDTYFVHPLRRDSPSLRKGEICGQRPTERAVHPFCGLLTILLIYSRCQPMSW